MNWLRNIVLFVFVITQTVFAYSEFDQVKRIKDVQYLPSFLSSDLLSQDQSIVLKSSNPKDILLNGFKRSIQFLSSRQLGQYGISHKEINSLFKQRGKSLSDYYIFANFTHGVKDELNRKHPLSAGVDNPWHESASNNQEALFWIAVIPKSVVVEDVYFQIEWFYDGAGAHAQVRFELDQDILLIPQDINQKSWSGKQPIDSRDISKVFQAFNQTQYEQPDASRMHWISGNFVYSLNAVRTENGQQNWGPIEGLLGEFANALNFSSAAHQAQLYIPNGTLIEELKLYSDAKNKISLSNNKKKEMFKYVLETSHLNQIDGIYNTVLNSCVTVAIQAVAANGKGIKVDPYFWNPYLLKDYFQKLNYANNQPSQNFLNVEDTFNYKIVKRDNIGSYPQRYLTGPHGHFQKYLKQPKLNDVVLPLLPVIATYEFSEAIKALAFYFNEAGLTKQEVGQLVAAVKAGDMQSVVSNPKVFTTFVKAKSDLERSGALQNGRNYQNFFQSLSTEQLIEAFTKLRVE